MHIFFGMEAPLRERSGGHTGAAPTVRLGDMMEFGRGGACVPARVALQGRIHRSSPRTMRVFFLYGNAATRTFGRAHRHRPYSFVWADDTRISPHVV